MEERKEKRIIMFPLPFPGHFNPLVQLARIFHHRGFSITIIHTSFNFPDTTHYPNFTFRTIHHHNEGEEEEDPLSKPDASGMDLVTFIRQLREGYANPFRESLKAEVGGGERACCLVSDVVWGRTTEVAAEEVGIRRMVLTTSGVASFCAFAAYPLLRDKHYLPIQDSRLDELVTELPPLRVKDLPVMETNEPEELYRVVNNMVEGAKSSSGIIWNTFEDLERIIVLMNFSTEFQVLVFPVGPFYKHSENILPTTKNKEDHVTTDWLNKQDPRTVVYVSFGSLADIEEKEFLEIAWGLRNTKQPFLWVVRPGMVQGTEWLESLPCGFLENIGQKGQIVKWVNQLEVLAHPAVGAFWTHCGWNSTLESICEGVPMICTPFFTDQRVNARYIVDVWQVGMILERSKLDRKEIEKLLRKEMGEEIRESCLKWKDRANVCLSKDGSSSKRFLQGLDPKTTANLFAESVCMGGGGGKAVNDEECFVLMLETQPSGLTTRSKSGMETLKHTVWGCFSQRTGLLVQLEDSYLVRIKTGPEEEDVLWETTSETMIQGYKRVDGIQIAHRGRTRVALLRLDESLENHSKTTMEESWEIEEVGLNKWL
ncbi:hypothetical protein IGI04_027499 [Brassica rapa subsp. trilocularis]|uniref:UDP-glycosyltransferases domain-containing protein n=1 Tax=Brassica rapa subsp. trilocularis TaxID=1813537 RepID=A0ABQ7KZ63_BRACM|nr:hypothetical protein IGI04_027499 [Brassica rapa subsp. trilocularis]